MKKYNLINNVLGWACFVISAITYLLTIEPTASFWDCPEFISQGAKLEVGHPPGNPMFILTARFFITLFGGDMHIAAIAVNSMSALLSAGTILLLFWTITHLIKKLIVRDDAETISPVKTLVIMMGGICGALAYTWSDTFWFSAVEGEVYAFSSFCTALVIWLIFKWENRAEQPHSDRYLVLIAYVIGVSIAVHLLNLLCIPAIVLVFYYKKFKNVDVKGSLLALGISFVIVAVILYGLVPGFVKVAQAFELLFVNSFGLSYNSGVLAYAIILVAVLVLTVRALYLQKSISSVKTLMFFSVVLSGIPFISDSVLLWIVLIAAIGVYLLWFCSKLPVRIFNVIALSILVIFIGYSSYALLLIRASSNTPMNQNAPDNVFALESYLSREQYGETPLFYGPTYAERLITENAGTESQPYLVAYVDDNGYPMLEPIDGVMRDENGRAIDTGSNLWSKVAKSDPSQPDKYVKAVHKPDYKDIPQLKVPFTRIFSNADQHVSGYKSWSEYSNPDFEQIPVELRKKWADDGYAPLYELSPYLPNMSEIVTSYDGYGQPRTTESVYLPGYGTNLRYFLNYQLNHMYWRYFMWNFAGRQNDIQGNGEPHLGNWISGIPAIDNLRIGDQSLLPDEFGKGNKGHNVFYMLPLLMGIIGLLWQALCRHTGGETRGIEQFWVVFFLFFMTGIAIVLYLNQTPGQPRERDYAFAGSFYAFAIWIGLGVPAIWSLLCNLVKTIKSKKSTADAGEDSSSTDEKKVSDATSWAFAALASIIGIAIPLQMVSQTWDDHDRSHRYTARDFGMNYLNSLDENAIIFTNGDNDTFPLWYAQEVEGVRRDVRVVNLSYLSTDWYAAQIAHPTYEAAPVPMFAGPLDYAYDNLSISYIYPVQSDVTDLETGMKKFYAEPIDKDYEARLVKTYDFVQPLDRAAVYKAFNIDPQSKDSVLALPYLNDMSMSLRRLGSAFGQSKILTFDIISKSIVDGWKRPVYFASTVGPSYYIGLDNYLNSTGMALQMTPFNSNLADDVYVSPIIEKAYENIMSKYRWGGLDDPVNGPKLYLDETVRKMLSSTRNSIIEIAEGLVDSGEYPASEWAVEYAAKTGAPAPSNRYDMARNLLNLLETKLPEKVSQYESMQDVQMAYLYTRLYAATGNPADLERAEQIINTGLKRYAQLINYASKLSSSRFNRLGRSELYALRYPAMFLAMQNYLDVRAELLQDEGLNAELIADLDYMFSLDNIISVSPFIYVMGYTLEDIGGYPRGERIDLMYTILEANEVAGIDPMERSTKYATDNGISINRWSDISH